MPIAAASAPAAPAQVTAVVPAQPGATVAAGGAVLGPVVAWAMVTDATQPGGVRIDPVWVSTGRTWTPDQYRASTGDLTTLVITAQ